MRRYLLALAACTLAVATACSRDGAFDADSQDAGGDTEALGGDWGSPDGGPDADGGEAPPDADAADVGAGDEGDSGDAGYGDQGADGGEIGQGDVYDDVDALTPGDEVPIVDCGTALEAPAEGGVCSTQGSGGALVIRGIVLAPSATYEGGEVLISDGGTILCVGCDCSAQTEYAGATIVTCADGVVSPGLINAHDHLTYNHNSPGEWGDIRYEHRHDWRTGAHGFDPLPYESGNNDSKLVTWSELRQVMAGTTSMAGSGKADGLMRNLDKESGLEGLDQDAVYYNTFPLGDQDGTLLKSGCDYPGIEGPWVIDENDCYHAHVAEGIDVEARNEFLCLSSTDNGGVDVTAENTAFVHAVGLLAVDAEELASNGASVLWSPRSNISLYGNTTPVVMYHHMGVRVGIGTDWTVSGSINILRELQCASYLDHTHFGNEFSDRQLWLMATAWNADILAMSEAIGHLAAGYVADVAVYDSKGEDNVYDALIHAGVQDTVLVLRGGLPLYGDAAVVAALPFGQAPGCEEIPGGVCGVSKAACVMRETGLSMETLAAANAGNYGLFFCGDPDGETTCVPMRPGEYSGETTSEDPDGDGIKSNEDLCPEVFDPPRLVDGETQADHDKDGAGDMCDPCPLDPDTSECTPPNPLDKDKDGIQNAFDNCPYDWNDLQEDGDTDGVGDVCDGCPEYPNPGNSACPSTIYAVKQNEVSWGDAVFIDGVVTAVASPRFWIQVPESSHDPVLGHNYSGIFIYVPATNPMGLEIPAEGDLVRVYGNVKYWWGQLEIDQVDLVEILDTGTPVPTPVAALASDVGTGGSLAEAMEGVLVSVSNGTVTEVNPPAGPGDSDPTNEYVLDGALRVNDYIYATAPFPTVGDVLSVTGVLRWSNEDSKIEPRRADDIFPALKLKGLSPAQVVIWEGTSVAVPVLQVELTAPAPAGGVTIALVSAAPEYVVVPESVVVPEGAKAASVPLTALAAAPDLVGITASFLGVEASASVLVIAEQSVPAVVAVSPSPLTVGIDTPAKLQVGLDLPAPPLGAIVALSAEPAGVIEFPAVVEIPAFEDGASASITGLVAGTTVLHVSTASGGVDVQVEVIDVPLLGLVMTEVFYNPDGNDSGLEWVELFNGTPGPLDLSAYSLGWGGTDYTYGTMQLSGTVGAGECIVVGGPTSSEVNYLPVFFLAQDFSPDIQNLSNDADGIALFNVPAASVTASTVPMDAVIYGPENGNNLIDETGAPGVSNTGGAGSGSSIELTPAGWTVQPAPTPNSCGAAF